MSPRRVAATYRHDLLASARNPEQLLLVLGIPVLLLVFFANIDVLPSGGGEAIDTLAPGVLAVAVMSTAMTNLAIAVGFDREYGFLKRLGTTPLRRSELLCARVVVVLSHLAVQLAVLVPLAIVLGWEPTGGGLGRVTAAVILAGVAFGGIAMILAGTLRGLVVLAAANAIYVVLLLAGGTIIAADELPSALGAVARLLPPGALAEVLRGATVDAGTAPGATAWAVLAVWAVAAPALAARVFRWDPGR